MNDGIFYQGLNQQAGNDAAHLFVNVINNRQLVAKTGLFNGDIVFDLIELFFDINLLIVF